MMLRRQAVETLQKSTKMFEQALRLLKEGQRTEAEELGTAARIKRSDSIWLMGKANKFDQEFHSIGRQDFSSNSAAIWHHPVERRLEKPQNSEKR
jgi:hypothetical protein